MTYANQLRAMTTHSLLFLEFSKRQNKHMTNEKMNALLVRYLKVQLKKSSYQLVKKDIKRLLIMAKVRTNDLESCINVLYEKCLICNASNDLEAFGRLILDIGDSVNIEAVYSDKKDLPELIKDQKSRTIYVLTDDIEECFNSTDSAMVQPMNVVFSGNDKRGEAIKTIISNSPSFCIVDELVSSDGVLLLKIFK